MAVSKEVSRENEGKSMNKVAVVISLLASSSKIFCTSMSEDAFFSVFRNSDF